MVRHVAVLVDDSDSMQIVDRALTPAEKLKLALEAWDFYQQQIGACDEQLQGLLQEPVGDKPKPDLGVKKELRHNAPKAMPAARQSSSDHTPAATTAALGLIRPVSIRCM